MVVELKKTPLMLFSKSLANIAVVQLIAKDLDGVDVKKRNIKRRFLYQSYIVYLVACWQEFIRTLAHDSFDALNSIYPLSESQQTECEELLNAINRFNTPLTYHIDKLIQKATGIERISSHWHWKNMTNDLAKQRLAELLNIRHEIAHSGYSGKPLSFDGNLEHMDFLYNLGSIMNNVIGKHIKETTGQNHYSIEPLRD
jgi:hypothetical protein